ncbi:hypothetical protein ACFVVM_28435 [Nocardia sp. NPDC058176]|uniref:DUF7373 family lipoprotein n=1 Tax=Nocardia sp. NPDC058176 TaxID=3346368 RepID=UPI0036DB4843
MSTLQVGNYPSEPTILGTANNDDEARTAEAMRLAEFVPLPSDIDPALQFTRNNNTTRTFITGDSVIVTRVMSMQPADFDSKAAGFIAGFYSNAQSDDNFRLSHTLENYVLLFDNESSAQAASIALGDQHRQYYADEYQNAELPNFLTARSYWHPEWAKLVSWYAHGRFVIHTASTDHLSNELETNDLPALVRTVEQSLTKVSGSLDKFTPTPREQWSTLQRDVDGMIGKTVTSANNLSPEDITPIAYSGRATLHGSRNSGKDGEYLDEFGVDQAAFNGGALYRARDEKAAEGLAVARAQLGKLFKPAPAPEGLPIAHCNEARGKYQSGARFRCTVAAGRFTADISAEQLADAHQRISSQYAMLINSK